MLAIALVSLLAANALAVDHQVMVGGGGLVYNPSTVDAAVGDTVTFMFMPKNHTVTQSSFSNPCALLQNGTQTGFNSGYRPVARSSLVVKEL